MSKNELSEGLAKFSGDQGSVYPWSTIYPTFALTEGAKFLADNARAYWLMDIISSHQKFLLRDARYFQVWRLAVMPDSQAALVCYDENGRELARQQLAYVSFPLSAAKLYVCSDGEHLTIRLPQEF